MPALTTADQEERMCFVSIWNYASKQISAVCGVHQGLIMGPLLFNIFRLLFGHIIQFSCHNYADETHIHLASSLSYYSLCKATLSLKWEGCGFALILKTKNQVTCQCNLGLKDYREITEQNLNNHITLITNSAILKALIWIYLSEKLL